MKLAIAVALVLFSAPPLAADDRDKEDHSEFERVRSQLASSIRMLIESPPDRHNHTVTRNVPFFVQLGEKKLIDVFAGIAISSLGLDGADAWVKRNAAAAQEYAAFAQSLPRY